MMSLLSDNNKSTRNSKRNDKYYITFVFLTPSQANNMDELVWYEELIGRMAYLLKDAKYVHVELKDMNERSASIIRTSSVFYMERTHSKKEYFQQRVNVTKDQYERIFKFIEEHANKKTPFNNYGFFTNFLPLLNTLRGGPYDAQDTAFFCSELLTRALIVGGVLSDDIDPCVTTPDDLYTHITKDNTTVIEANKRKIKVDKAYMERSNFHNHTIINIDEESSNNNNNHTPETVIIDIPNSNISASNSDLRTKPATRYTNRTETNP